MFSLHLAVVLRGERQYLKMNRKRAFIFPGQGAQQVGMGRDFYVHFSEAKEVFQEADDLLGRDLSKLIFEGPLDRLTRTDNCQVAIYVTSVALLRVVERQFPDLKPSACAGLSLGEYSALTAADKMPFAECLPLVQARATSMHEACLTRPGTMVVVLGQTPEALQALLDRMSLPKRVWIANLNCPGQVVLAGTQEGIQATQSFLREQGVKRVLPLEVAGAFHCPLMEEARRRLEPLIRQASVRESGVDVYMNAKGGVCRSVDEIRSLMIEQVTDPVYWERGIHEMEGAGIGQFIEIGPGKTLSGMNRRIGVSGTTFNVEKIEDLETVGEGLHGSALKE